MATRRFLLILPALIGLSWLSVGVARSGTAESIASEASSSMMQWTATGGRPNLEAWLEVRNAFLRAQGLSPGDPNVEENLGVLHALRSERHDYIPQAFQYFMRALELRPSSPYTWANLAEALYRDGRTDQTFEYALRRAAMLGPYEPEVQRTLADYGLAVWSEAAPETRAAVTNMVAAGMRRSPVEILQISERRGRLGPACAHVRGDSRLADSKWIKLCESKEITP